jgi:hypothetical protein
MTTTIETTAALTSATGPEAAAGVTAALVAAVSETWAAIRARHPEVPAVVVTFGSGTLGTTRGQERLGHFAGGRWLPGRAPGAEDGEHGAVSLVEDTSDALAELFVGGEGLRLGAVELLDTLLHEAAHALAHARGIADTSRQGRYHNARYRKVAVELGLEVAEAKPFGWTDTKVPADTRAAYAAQLVALRAALLAWRRPEVDARRTPASPGTGGGQDDTGSGAEGGEERDTNRRKNGVVARCACLAPAARQFRVSEPVLALGPIICGVCEEPFTVVDPD